MTFGSAQCPVAYPPLLITDVRDLPKVQPYLWAARGELHIPYEVLVAQALQESSWKLDSYRYEPNYDRIYISRSVKQPSELMSPRERWIKHPAWKSNGPTAEQWFAEHPKRTMEANPKKTYKFVAQTRLAASYGILQCMFPTAVQEGFDGLPEDLWKPENVVWALKHLGRHLTWARKHAEWDEMGVWMVALCRFNGGAYGNNSPTELDDKVYLEHIQRRYVACWGQPFFPL